MGIKEGRRIVGEPVSFGLPNPIGGGPNYFKDKCVAVDLSVIFHSLFNCNTEAYQLLCASPTSSVQLLVAKAMNEWIIRRGLHQAKLVIFVYDPALIKKPHCEKCQEASKQNLNLKYDITGRNKLIKKRKESMELWKAQVAQFNAVKAGEPTYYEQFEKKLKKQWLEHIKHTNIVNQSLHEGFLFWIGHCNQKRKNGIALQEKDIGGTNVAKKKINFGDAKKNKAKWPLLICINSPFEADDQLAHLYKQGLADVIITCDLDLLAFGCFNVVRTKLSGGHLVGYTDSSIIKNVAQAFGITEQSNSFFHQLSKEEKHAEIRMLLCFASCIQGNDYIKTALSPSVIQTKSSKKFLTEWYNKKRQKQALDELQIINNVFDVAGQVWEYILPFKRKKTFVDFYKTGDAYMQSFYKAFKIYHHSKRYWHICKEVGVDDVTIERFINREIQVLSMHSECFFQKVALANFYIATNTIEEEPRMGLVIDFELYPPECLPKKVLLWWLRSRGIEAHDTCADNVVQLYVLRNLTRRPFDLLNYKTRFSTLLQCMLSTSAPIPRIYWVQKNTWELCYNENAVQEIDPVKTQLQKCNFKFEEKKRTRSELIKAEKHSRDGSVDWKTLKLVYGKSKKCGAVIETVKFDLKCIPSECSDPYAVEVVMTKPGPHVPNETKLCHDTELSYCTCMRGSVEDYCGHIAAALLWLQKLKTEWSRSEDVVDPNTLFNFYELAKQINLPPSIIFMSQQPLQVETMMKIHAESTSTKEPKERKRPFSALTVTHVHATNKKMIDEGMSKQHETLFLKICKHLSNQRKAGEINLEQTPMWSFHVDWTDDITSEL